MDKIKKAVSEVRGIVALVSGFISFLFIMSVVGNPHVAETFLIEWLICWDVCLPQITKKISLYQVG